MRLAYCTGIQSSIWVPMEWGVRDNVMTSQEFMWFPNDMLYLYGRNNTKKQAPTLKLFPYENVSTDLPPSIARFFDGIAHPHLYDEI